MSRVSFTWHPRRDLWLSEQSVSCASLHDQGCDSTYPSTRMPSPTYLLHPLSAPVACRRRPVQICNGKLNMRLISRKQLNDQRKVHCLSHNQNQIVTMERLGYLRCRDPIPMKGPPYHLLRCPLPLWSNRPYDCGRWVWYYTKYVGKVTSSVLLMSSWSIKTHDLQHTQSQVEVCPCRHAPALNSRDPPSASDKNIILGLI